MTESVPPISVPPERRLTTSMVAYTVSSTGTSSGRRVMSRHRVFEQRERRPLGVYPKACLFTGSPVFVHVHPRCSPPLLSR